MLNFAPVLLAKTWLALSTLKQFLFPLEQRELLSELGAPAVVGKEFEARLRPASPRRGRSPGDLHRPCPLRPNRSSLATTSSLEEPQETVVKAFSPARRRDEKTIAQTWHGSSCTRAVERRSGVRWSVQALLIPDRVEPFCPDSLMRPREW